MSSARMPSKLVCVMWRMMSAAFASRLRRAARFAESLKRASQIAFLRLWL